MEHVRMELIDNLRKWMDLSELEFDWPEEMLPVLEEIGPLGVLPGSAVVRIAAK